MWTPRISPYFASKTILIKPSCAPTMDAREFAVNGNLRASIVGAHEGFIKVVSDAKYGEILGVHIIGPIATELVAEAVAVLELEGTVEELMFTIHAQPTVCEGMLYAFSAVEGKAINA